LVSWRLAEVPFHGINEVSMISKKFIFSLLVLAFSAMVAGCASPKRDSSIPWSRPADWEGQIPGMSGGGIGR
jgi:hypothetical protein